MTSSFHRVGFCVFLIGTVAAQQPIFAPEVLFDASGQRSILATADLDADGDQDLVVFVFPTQGGGPILELYPNPGTANFRGVIPVPLGPAPLGFTGTAGTGDFNGDGFADLALGVYPNHPLGSGVIVHPGTGSTAIGPGQHIPTPGWPTMIVTRTRPGDPFDDLVLGLGSGPVLYTGFATQVQWLEFAPTGVTLGFPAPLPGGSFDTRSIVVADATGDALDDVVLVPLGTGVPVPTPLPILQSVGTGFFGGPALPTLVLWRGLPTVLDFDADGDQDIAIVDQMGSSQLGVVVLRNDGAANFSVQPLPGPYPEPFANTLSVNSGDVDGDGRDEVIASIQGSGTITLFGSDGAGSLAFASRLATKSTAAPGTVAVVDVDNDGDDDLVGARNLLLSPGAPYFSPPPPCAYPATEAADIDGDGDPEYFYSPGIEYALNDGTGAVVFPGLPAGIGLRSQVLVPAMSVPRVKARVDLNGDGWLDAIVAESSAGPPAPRNYLGGPDLVLRDAGPTFAVPGTAIEVREARFADVNGDGTRDLLHRDGLALGVPGAVDFVPISLPLGGYTIIDVADVDGDLDPDLLARYDNLLAGTVSFGILRNDGNLGFTLLPIAAPGAFDLRFADPDADLDPDLVALRGGGGQYAVQLFVNTGGSMTPLNPIPIGALNFVYAAGGPRLLPVADLDLDGRRDLLVLDATPLDHDLCFLRSLGPGLVFDTPRHFETGAGVLADVDGDGDLDFVGHHLVPNTTRFGPSAGRRGQYGTGTPGSGGFTPLLGATGPFRPGETVVLRARGALGGAPALLAVGTAPVTLPNFLLPGVTTLVWPWVAAVPIPAIGGANLAPGAGTLEWAFSVPPSLALTTVVAQFAFADPQGPAGISASNGLQVRFGL